MAKHKRSDDWGFPRWRSNGAKGRDAAKVRLYHRDGCTEFGDRPAPKAPHSPERWYFCQAHAAEYNKNWDYFANLTNLGGDNSARPKEWICWVMSANREATTVLLDGMPHR